jgi:hypothetical protein
MEPEGSFTMFTRALLVIVGYLEYYCYQRHGKLTLILLSRLSPFIDEIIGNHQSGFQHNRSTVDQVLFAFAIY